MQPIIEVENLVKRYKKADRNAVDDISFQVMPGELFALLGPNGAGKTTTISILTTTLAPTSGKVRIAGFDPDREAGAVRQNLGIIFQNPSLDWHLTGEENIRMHAIMYGVYPFAPGYGLMPKAYKKDVDTLADVLGMGKDVFKPVRTFSGGMRRKLEIIRSLMHRPKVLFLDEPTSGLDAQSRRSLWHYLKEVREQSGTTFCMTTHYLEEAEQVDRVCIINKGQVVANGTPQEVKANLIEEYLLIDSDDREKLRLELRISGVTFTETPLFKIGLDGTSTHQLLKSIQTPLTVIQTHMPTLEDAYLKIVGQDDET